jgi:hypothetical protein
MKELHEKFFTPEYLDKQKILSKTEQWKRRKRGELKFYKIGTKILYSEKHLSDFFALCEGEDIKKEK